MEYENFMFYGSFLKTVDAIPDDYLKLKVMEAIVRYGCAWELPNAQEEPLVYAFLQMAIPNIDKAKDAYTAKGGRPSKYTQEEYNVLFEQGLSNKEVEEQLSVSHATVERKKKIWRAEKEKAKEKDKEKEKEKESEDMRNFDTFEGGAVNEKAKLMGFYGGFYEV